LAVSPAFSEAPKKDTNPKSPEGNTMDEKELKAEQDKLKAQQAEIDAKTAAFNERETQIKATEKALAIKAISSDLDQLVKDGKVLPAQQAALAEFMSTLDSDKDVVEFGEGDDKKKLSQRGFMQSYLAGLPKVVEFKELSDDDGDDNGESDDSQELASQA
ncbi:hypothetical protein, partial [Sansalvadorimonas verongulae]|uniref:hypothetical protein n=1 Tax=Sansalvadorimonas verongulae TaxID=2172824 RepID=UPI001E4C2EC6